MIKALDSIINLLHDEPKLSSIVTYVGDIPCLIRLLYCDSSAILEQAILAVSIFAFASVSSQRAIFVEGGLSPLLCLLNVASTPVMECATAAIVSITTFTENAFSTFGAPLS